MRETPPIEVHRDDVRKIDGPLAYVAALLKGSLPVWPEAVARITGNGMIASSAWEQLERVHGVPTGHVRIDQVFRPKLHDSVSVAIVYAAASASTSTRSVWVEFKLDLEALPIKVEFKVSPDGAYVEEVEAGLEKLKAVIKKHALGGRIQNIKIGTTPIGTAEFDRETSDAVKTSLKAKIKTALSADVQLPGMKRAVTVELYGSIFSKIQLDGVTKAGGEAGLTLTIPLDFL